MSVDGLADAQTADSEGTRGSLLVWLPVGQHISLSRSAITTDFKSLKDLRGKGSNGRTKKALKSCQLQENACVWPNGWQSPVPLNTDHYSQFWAIFKEFWERDKSTTLRIRKLSYACQYFDHVAARPPWLPACDNLHVYTVIPLRKKEIRIEASKRKMKQC